MYNLTKDSNLITGINFNFTNLNYVTTNININNTTSDIIIEEYKQSNGLTITDIGLTLSNALENLYKNGQLDESKIKLNLIDSNDITGEAMFKITFSSFYTTTGYVKNYDYTFDFQFKPSTEQKNYLLESISANSSLIPNNFNNAFALNTYLNDSNNINEINNYIESHKSTLIKNEEYSWVKIDFINSSFDQNNFNILWLSFKINDSFIETAKLNDLTQITISKTILAISKNSQKIDFSDIVNNNFNSNDILSITSTVKTPINEEIKVIEKTIEKTNNQNIVFINFILNGVYLEDNINSFTKNYVVKVKVENSSSNVLFSLMTENQQHYEYS